MSALTPLYPWMKSLHIISVIAWMAGLLYLPRLFVYHAAEPLGSPTAKTFEIMERRLQRAIMAPAMVGVYVFGICLALIPGIVDWSQGWIYAKLACVVLLTVLHHRMSIWRRALAAGSDRHSIRFYRFMNEVPTLLMIVIIILVVVRPF